MSASGVVFGFLTLTTSQVAEGVGWATAATTAAAATVILERMWARIWFGSAALLTGYLAVVALGPLGDEEYAYPFTAIYALPFIAMAYALAFRAVFRVDRSRVEQV